MQKWWANLNLSLFSYILASQTAFSSPQVKLFQTIFKKFYFEAILKLFLAIIQDKLVWIFNAFDKDGGGTIDYGEIRLQLKSPKLWQPQRFGDISFPSRRRCLKNHSPGTLLLTCSGWLTLSRTRISWWPVSLIFGLIRLHCFSAHVILMHCKLNTLLNWDRKAVDTDGDGEITKEEFVKHALKSRFLQKMLENWLKSSRRPKVPGGRLRSCCLAPLVPGEEAVMWR